MNYLNQLLQKLKKKKKKIKNTSIIFKMHLYKKGDIEKFLRFIIHVYSCCC